MKNPLPTDQRPVIRLPEHENNKLFCHVFGMILPCIEAYVRDREYVIEAWTSEGRITTAAQLITCYRYPSLQEVSGGMLQWVSGKPDAEAAREQYIKFYRNSYPIMGHPFGVYLFHKLHRKVYNHVKP